MLIVWVRSLHTPSRGDHTTFLARPSISACIEPALTDISNKYCEFGGTVKKCEEWLEKHHPDMHAKLYSEGML